MRHKLSHRPFPGANPDAHFGCAMSVEALFWALNLTPVSDDRDS